MRVREQARIQKNIESSTPQSTKERYKDVTSCSIFDFKFELTVVQLGIGSFAST